MREPPVDSLVVFREPVCQYMAAYGFDNTLLYYPAGTKARVIARGDSINGPMLFVSVLNDDGEFVSRCDVFQDNCELVAL